MANTMTFNSLVEKALNDQDFRNGLMEDPSATLKSAGMENPDAVVAALEKVDWTSLARVANSFGSGNRVDTAFC